MAQKRERKQIDCIFVLKQLYARTAPIPFLNMLVQAKNNMYCNS